MISMATYLQRQLAGVDKAPYGFWLRAVYQFLWLGLTAGETFKGKNGERVVSPTGVGALRLVLGGLLTTFIGLAVLLGGLLRIAIVLISLPLAPITALVLYLWSSHKLTKSLQDFQAQVAAAKSKVKL